MKSDDIAQVILDDQEFIAYVSDLETYDLLYLNKKAKEAFGIVDDSYIGKKCHKVLQSNEEPCEYCTNNILSPEKKHYWQIHNQVINAHYSLVDSLIEINGKNYRLEIATDITKQKEALENLEFRLSSEQTLVRCIQTLMEDVSFERAISNLLKIVLEYYCADRAYLFSIDKKNRIARKLHSEYSHPSFKYKKENIEFTDPSFSLMLERFYADGQCSVSDINAEFAQDTLMKDFFTNYQVNSFRLIPLYSKKRITAFIGIDNPKRKENDLSLLHSIGVFVNNDMKKRALLDKLNKLSYSDHLTSLGNRNKYVARVEELETSYNTSLGIIDVDINGLKKTNELYGEHYGDFIIQQVAKLLSKYLPHDLYRVGGGEFIALCQNISQKEFEDIISSLREENKKIAEYSFAVGGSWQENKIDILKAVTHSGELMYAEKQNYYKTLADEHFDIRANAVEILINELQSGFFYPYLQPKVNMLTGEIIGAEALVRKRTHDGENIAPDKFIPVYEHEGTIRHLDFYILERTCVLLQQLIKENRPLKISVNFSRVTFMSYDLVDEIINVCAQYSIPHKYIEIEITESIDKMDMSFFDKKLKSIKEAGFGVSLDDFGAKYSNLVMLSMPHFSEIKLDKSLVDNITDHHKKSIVIEYLIKMIEALDTSSCIAEGVETEEQKNALINYGCVYGQGYLFYKPLSIDDFLDAYKKNRDKFI